MYHKRKILIMLIVITLLQIILPTVTTVIETAIASKSIASDTFTERRI